MRVRSNVIAVTLALAGLLIAFDGAPATAPAKVSDEEGWTIAFTTSEFTQPTVDVSPDGKVLYLDVLGEIYSAPITGGAARKLELGAGWKERPALSLDGTKLAFMSDREGPRGVWVSTLADSGSPVPYDIRRNADVVAAAWVSNRDILTSGRSLVDITGSSFISASESGIESISIRSSALSKVSSITASADGRQVYYLRGGLKRLNRDTGVETPVSGLPEDATQLRLTPDGKQLGFVPEVRSSPVGDVPFFSLLDLGTGKVRRTRCAMEPNFGVDGDGVLHATYDFLPDGRAIVHGRGGRIRSCKLDGKESVIPITASVRVAVAKQARISPPKGALQLRFLAASPDGVRLAVTARGSTWLVDSHDGSVKKLTAEARPEFMPSFSPDGARIAYVALESDGTSTIRARVLSSGREQILHSTKGLLANPTWSPNGRRLAFAEVDMSSGAGSEDNISLKWMDIQSGESGTFVKGLDSFMNSSRSYPSLAWDRASQGIYYVSRNPNPHFSHQAIGQNPETVYELDSTVWDVSVSPSGRFVAFMDINGISVAPASGSNSERLPIDHALIRRLTRVTDSGADYMAWFADDRLAWSVQNEVYVSNETFTRRQAINVRLPEVSQTPSRSRVAYVGARIITMGNLGVIENGVIVTNGRQIEFVGPSTNSAILGAQIVSVDGKTIIPGMIDVHQHQSPRHLDITPDLSQRLFSSAAFGVTTVFDPSFRDVDGSELRERSDQDSYPGASFYTAGHALMGPTGNQALAQIDSYEDAVGFVKRKAQAGSPLVKGYLQPTRRERRWLSKAARQAGLGITGHERNDLRTQLSMVVDGYNGTEHVLFGRGGRLYSDVQRFLVMSGISMTGTMTEGDEGLYLAASRPPDPARLQCLVANHHIKWLATSQGVTEKDVREGTMFEMATQYAHMLNDGGNINLGGHSLPWGLGTHWEMWFLQMVGATPISALRAATVNGAKKLGMEARIGSLNAGMDADFVVLNSNPLDDIRNSLDISRVVRRGRSLTWPAQVQPPSWTMQGSWDECGRWNLGLPH